ncbi:MAG: alkaline phosphatase family protein [Streptosporangiaceae bacterium]
MTWARAASLLALLLVLGTTLSPGQTANAAGRAGPARAANHTPIVVIVMEGGRYQSIVGSSRAPFINGTMIAHGLLETNYHAIPDSLHDYLLIVSGRSAPPADAANLFGRLGRAPTWREYMESMPSTCYLGGGYHKVNGTDAALYARDHNPAIEFSNITRTSLCSRLVPLTPQHFHPDALPRFSFVVPNECDDMHTMPVDRSCPMWNGHTNRASTEIQLGDQWLASFVPLVARSATVIVTWDEGNRADEHVPTILYGVGVRHGEHRALLHHPSLEAGLYRYFRLGAAPGLGATSTPLVIP